MYLCNIYTCRQAQSLETTKKWLCQLCKFAGMEAFGKMPLTLLRPLRNWRNWKGAKLVVISSQLAQVMEYTEIDPATEGFNKAQWKKTCCFLCFFGVMFSSLFDSILLRLAFAFG